MKLQYSPAYLPAGLPLSLAMVLFHTSSTRYRKHLVLALEILPIQVHSSLDYLLSNGNEHTLYCELHAKYGPIVRVALNKVTISDPVAIPLIYSVGRKFPKVHQSSLPTAIIFEFFADFYILEGDVSDAYTGIHEVSLMKNLFSTRDNVFHKKTKSTIAAAYSISFLKQLEPLVSDCTSQFMSAMTSPAGQPVSLEEWLQWYAFEVVGSITFF